MLTRLRCIPPVGNNILFKPKVLTADFFKPFNFCLYQSGTAALAAALLLVKDAHKSISKPRVLIPAYTCPDIISAAKFAGVTPVLIDFVQGKPQLNCEQILSNINDNVIAVVAINFLGISENIAQLRRVLPDKITIIEDSAQDFPTDFSATKWQGDIIISSFGRGKPLSLLGGGILLTKDKGYKDKVAPDNLKDSSQLDRLKHWIKVKLYNLLLNPFLYNILTKATFLKLGNTQYKALTAVVHGSTLIASLIESNFELYKKRTSINQFYATMFNQLASADIIDLASNCNHDLKQPLLRYPILITDKTLYKTIYSALEKAGLGASKMYKTTLPNVDGVCDEFYNAHNSINNAEQLASALITLPTHNGARNIDLYKIKTLFELSIVAKQSLSAKDKA